MLVGYGGVNIIEVVVECFVVVFFVGFFWGFVGILVLMIFYWILSVK